MKLELDDLGVFSTIAMNGSKPGIVLRAENIRSERTGIHAAVSVFYGSTRLAYDTFNVARDEERNRLSKSATPGLAEPIRLLYPKEALKNDLDNFCAEIWAKWQERDPAEEIVIDLEDKIKPPAWIFEPLILADQPNIFFGHRSAAKSLTALIIHATIQLQWADNPFRLKPPANYCESLYLDFERNSAMARYNLSRLQRGMELASLSIHYKRMSGPLSRNLQWVRQYLHDHPLIRLVIIDSMTPACGGNLNDTAPASEFFDAERTLKTTTLILAHTSKDTESKHKTVVGSFAFEAYAGNVWECIKSQEEESSVADICLYHRKPPAVYRTRKPLAFRVTFDEERHMLSVGKLDAGSIAEFVERMTLNMRILDLLKRDQLTSEQIAKALEEKVANVKMTVFRLKTQGYLVAVGQDGKSTRWGLVKR